MTTTFDNYANQAVIGTVTMRLERLHYDDWKDLECLGEFPAFACRFNTAIQAANLTYYTVYNNDGIRIAILCPYCSRQLTGYHNKIAELP